MMPCCVSHARPSRSLLDAADRLAVLVAREKSISQPELKLSLPTALLVAYVARLAEAWAPASRQGSEVEQASKLPDRETEETTRAYLAFHDRILALDATERALEKPLLDVSGGAEHHDCAAPDTLVQGNSIAEAVAIRSLGRLTPRIQTHVLAWQYSRPRPPQDDAAAHEALRSECAAWLSEAWGAGGIVPQDERDALLRPPEKAKARGQQQAQPAAARKRQKSE